MPFPLNTNLSNIDLGQLLKNKKQVANILLVVLALIISINLYSRQGQMNQGIKDNIIMESKKNQLLQELGESEKMVAQYRQILDKKDITSLMNSVNRAVQESGLRIISVNPERRQEYPLYSKLYIKLFLGADDYHKIGDLIASLESSSDLYKVETLRVQPLVDLVEEQKEQVSKMGKEELSVEILVTRFIFKG